jgi:hypothetical protein
MFTRYKKRTNEKQLVMCGECYAFYDGVYWSAISPSHSTRDPNKKIVMKIMQCPTCKNLELAICEVEFNLMTG